MFQLMNSPNNCPFLRLNGDEETRTLGLRRARAALSQLSYIPSVFQGGPGWTRTNDLSLIRGTL